MSSLPELESIFDTALEQVFKLIKDIEKHKWDAGVTIMANNGVVDVRGLGEVDTPAKAAGLIYLALKSFPPVSQQEIATALQVLMERSERIAKEARHWRGE